MGTNLLPYCMTSLEVSQLLGIESASIEQLPANSQWVFVTGEEGMTELLQSIALAFYNDRMGGLAPQANANTGKVKLGICDHGQQLPRIDYTYPVTVPERIPDVNRPAYLLGYGSEMHQSQPEHPDFAPNVSSAGVHSLFSPEARFKDFLLELRLAHAEGPARLNTLVQLMRGAWPLLQNVVIKGRELFFVVKGQNKSVTLTWKELPKGPRRLLLIVGDIYLRLSGKQSTDNPVSPSDVQGIVLIDEPELHLHPGYRRRLPRLLSNLFPQVQFIAATYSPVLLMGAPSNAVFLKIDRSENGLHVQQLDTTLAGKKPGDILGSKLFDLVGYVEEGAPAPAPAYDLNRVIEESLEAREGEDEDGRLFGGH